MRQLLLTVGIIVLIAPQLHGQQDQAQPDPASTSAQSDASTPRSDAERELPPVPIPISDIPARANEVSANVRRIATLVLPQDSVLSIEAAMAEQAAELVELRAMLNAFDPNRVSVGRVDDQRVAWTELQRTVNGWMTVLEGRWTALQSERSELREARDLWELTRDNAVSDDAQPEVVQRVDTILASLTRAEAGIDERSNTLAVMIEQVSNGSEVAVESLERLDGLSVTARQRILTRDADPFWRGLSARTLVSF